MDFKKLLLPYKPEQGRIARGTAFGILVLLSVFAAKSLYDWPSNESWWRLPLFSLGEAEVVRGAPISLVFFVLLVGACYAYVVNLPKAADFLVETEAELKKVNWPPPHEFLGSSFVVVVSVVLLGGFLAITDFLFHHLMRHIGKL
ncbi:MAG: preprotein translocase subunit SecE [Planctomycetes bacterium]|nr:preprotein translocase subunit SecE [Planctomycetota bacterium]